LKSSFEVVLHEDPIPLATTRKKAPKTQFVCQNCGYTSPKWLGRCTECGAWNSFAEETVVPARETAASRRAAISEPKALHEVDSARYERIPSGSVEFDRVLGGGFVPGSVVLLGGQPGIGKSTILLQRAASLDSLGKRVLYVSGEESEQQIKLRANRLGIEGKNIFMLSEQDLDSILAAVESLKPDFLIVDSIQTVTRAEFESAPGSVTQVRECAHALTEVAKQRGMPVILVGHVTKEGYLAGPKILEHVVDASLMFEGDHQHPYRILRATKNRFGSTDEIGVFEMTERGLQEVTNPSEYFLSERSQGVPGSVITCLLRGSRPVLLEIQALTAVSHYSMPQRTCTGFDPRRLAMILAVLERRAGVNAGAHDVFVNVAGGIRVDEPAADLAVAVAIASSVRNRPVPPDLVALGEVGLTGEVRRVQFVGRRVQEAARLGFRRILAPRGIDRQLLRAVDAQILQVGTLSETLKAAFG